MKRKLRVRQAQTVLPFGVGAVLDIQGESFVAAGIEAWPQLKTPVVSERLAARLGVTGFFAAPHTLNDRYDKPDGPGVPYLRFPGWLFCGACRAMVRFLREHEKPGEPPVCTSCAAAPRLTPMRFVRICPDGHLDDVDWWYWAHSALPPERRAACSEASRAWQARRLAFRVADRATGLEALSVRCGASTERGAPCGAERDLLDILGPQKGRCSGRNPWQRRDADKPCGQQVHIVQRTAGNVYYPLVYSALDIPRSAEPPRVELAAADAVRGHGYWNLYLDALDTQHADTFRGMIQADTDAPDGLIDALVAEATGTTPPTAPETPSAERQKSGKVDLSRDEWYAFDATELPDPTPEFSIRRDGLGLDGETEQPWAALDAHIDKVVLVDRLREVRALTGFRRHSPNGTLVPADTSGRLRWLPATEVYGEGIVLALDEQRLTTWENDPRVRAHVQGVRTDLDASFRDEQLAETVGDELSPRFLLLHTLAHLLVRQLSFDSGYTTAGLRERVYGRPEYGQRGLLIYTAAGDAEGTLGGLVRQGEAPHFAETLIRMLEAAAWCSADPLCAEHTGQGFGNLNRAACHACTLLPETSCQTGNTLLDRALVVGSARVPGYFADVLTASRESAAATALGGHP
ncbi:DrmB family protein [Streptomyces sp. NPDC058867]|uniref:DrmB family protein n=1 Tax=unclassified Streptomyces TaxID=2593676 RepID=UPI0036943D04